MGPNDGGKFVCAPERLKTPDCLVISIGSNNQYEFEEEVKLDDSSNAVDIIEILKWNNNCEIHIFDHTIEPISKLLYLLRYFFIYKEASF